MRTPSLKALLAQCFSFVLVQAVFGILNISSSDQFIWFLILHGLAASLVSILLKLDWWWWVLGFTFPMLVAVGLWANISTWFYLTGFFVLALIYWTVFITQVPYYPTDPLVFPEVNKLLPEQSGIAFCEIGSGIGNLSTYISSQRKDAQVVGVEIAPIPWLISVVKTYMSGGQSKFLLGSYESLDFSQFDVIYAYLSPAAMSSLWQKAQSEMKVGALLISYEFTIPNVPPDLCINIATNGTFIYIWRI